MARPGDPIRNHVTAAWFNETTRRNKQLGTGIPSVGLAQEFLKIRVYNHEAVAKDIYTPVAIGSAKLDYDKEYDATFATKDYNTQALDKDDEHNWVILQEPLPGSIGASADALVMGVTWINMGETDPAPDEYLTIVGTSPSYLDGAASGRGLILSRHEDAGNAIFWILAMMGMPAAPIDAIIDIRVNGFDFEYTKNGTDWTVWHTGGDCSVSS